MHLALLSQLAFSRQHSSISKNTFIEFSLRSKFHEIMVVLKYVAKLGQSGGDISGFKTLDIYFSVFLKQSLAWLSNKTIWFIECTYWQLEGQPVAKRVPGQYFDPSPF